jgi:cell division protease FtsH
MVDSGKPFKGRRSGNPQGDGGRRKGLGWRWLYVLLFALLVGYALYDRGGGTTQEISWQDFEKVLLARKAVERVEVVGSSRVDVYIQPASLRDSAVIALAEGRLDPRKGGSPGFHFRFGSVESLEARLKEAATKYGYAEGLDIRYVSDSNRLWELMMYVLPFLLLMLIWSLAARRLSGGGAFGEGSVFSFGKSTAKLQEADDRSPFTFDDVAGLDEAKTEVKEIVDFLKSPKDYTRLGAKIPKGVIIVGPPGTGKTLLVKAVAGEAQVPFFSISGSEFVEMFVGVGASRVRDLFRRAKERTPCIVFIDEIDAVGRARGKNAMFTGANDERESTLNQLLTEMDGFGTNSGVIVLAATNRADMLDPALLRPGRFDRHIYLELPDMKERRDIFKVHMRNLVMDETIDLDFLASQTPGFSGADIANICNEAALIAARQKKESIGRQDFIDAIDRVVAGLERKSKIISPREKRIIAFHESGHALVSWMLPHVDPLSKVSIIPRGKTLGSAWYLPEERQLHTEEELRQRLTATLGGRAAEEVTFGEVTSGALDDLEKVTRDAYAMVAFYGFNEKVGNVSFYDSTGMRDTGFQKPYGEDTAKMLDEEVRRLVADSYEKAKSIVVENRSALERLAALLLEKEVVFRQDLESVLGKRAVAPSQ